jgi:hypothetical protein
MPYRKTPLVEGCYYHIYTKSIAEYKIFNSVEEYQRGFETMNFYRAENPPFLVFPVLQTRGAQTRGAEGKGQIGAIGADNCLLFYAYAPAFDPAAVERGWDFAPDEFDA